MGQGGGRDRAWREEVKEDEEGEPVARSPTQQSGSNQTPDIHQLQQTWVTYWSHTLRTLRQGWYSFASVSVVWSVCQVEAPLHPSLLLVDVGWRLLLVCLLWVLLGGCVHALRCRLQPGQNQGGPPLRIQQEVITQHYLRTSPPRRPGHNIPLALALADSLLLCVLQEPLSDPSVPHIKALLSRLGSVCHTLGKADIGSEVTPEEVDRDSALIDKVKLIHSYLQQRMSSLNGLLQVQGDFEASVKDMLEGLEGLWGQLEDLHTGVTLTKEGSRGHGDLVSAQTDAETLFAVLGHYRNRLQCCRAHLRDSTLLLQELTWSHTHISNGIRSSSESVWPELLLQTNIEQFDKVQESFLSMEQQTSTFRAHLEGLGEGDEEGQADPLTQADGAHSRSVSRQSSLNLENGRKNNVWHRDSISTTSSVSSAEADTEADNPVSLCERSALHFTSTIGRLRKSGRRK